MSKFRKIVTLSVGLLTLGGIVSFTSSCSDNSKVISICASDVPHAQILNNIVRTIVEEKGYSLSVKTLDWTTQNDSVANKDYDANYFQHIPYLSTYNGKVELTATCKVHYEPLGIYKGKVNTLENVSSVVVCNDESNAIRALELLKVKGVITGDLPIDESGEKLTFEGDSWTSNNNVKVTLIAENLLVQSRNDYDVACLPCNTALTGNISATERIALEDDPVQVSSKANVIVVRKNDYLNDETYKAKIDVLTDALLTSEVREYIDTTYQGNIICNSVTQVDLRESIK